MPDSSIASAEWAHIEDILRPLTERERALVSDAVSLHAEFYRSSKVDTPSTRDRKATLRAIARIPTDEIWRAQHIDGWSSVLISDELRRAGNVQWMDPHRVSPEDLRAAAAAALVNYEDPRRGPKGHKGDLAATAIWSLWGALGGADGPAWVSSSGVAPVVQFAQLLLTIIFNRKTLSADQAAELLKRVRTK